MLSTRTAFHSLVMGACLCMLVAAPSHAQQDPGVYFVEPKDGAKVPPTFTVKFGLRGKQIGALGDLDPGKGHHHLIIDGRSVPKMESVPFDEHHKHFGDGKTQTQLTLPPGKHTLTLQFGDGAHRSYGDTPWSTSISVEVLAPTSAGVPPTAW